MAGVLAVAPTCMGLCRAVPLMQVRKANMPQTVFAEMMNREGNPTLLDITSLDQGFYLAAGIVPNCRYFADNNLQTKEKKEAIASYLAEGKTQFVVTRYADPGERYALIAEADGVFDLNDMRHYKLYERIEENDGFYPEKEYDMDTRISEKELRAFMERAYEKEGFEQEEARRIADVLMQADLFGIESHGAQRMMYYHQNIKSGSVDVRARAEVVRETPVSALLDGHFAMGHLTAAKAMNIAIEKAQKTGIGMVVVRNSSHYGIAGYYPLMAEREGLAAFSMTNTGPIMVPTFGREMMLGTNPMAFCMPADPYPFWFDASTTVVTLGKVEVYNKRGKPMPEGWTIDGEGRPCSDAHRMNQSILAGELGGILPLGGEGETTSGHKGYGLAIMVEALTGVLAQGMLSPEMCGAHGDHTSHFFMAFDPAMFGDPADIRARMSGYLQALRDSEKAPGYARIYTPGEKAHEAQKDRLQNGIPVEANTLAELRRIAAELGIEGV